jgi:hypothetical protein
MYTLCTHRSLIHDVAPRTLTGCEECLRTGDRWVHLRLCLTCGHVGCCDTSPNRHAEAHFHETQHPIVQSYLSDERWCWCYVDGVMLAPPPPAAGIDAPASPSASIGAPEPGGAAARRPGGLLSRLIGSLHRHDYLVGVIDDPVAAERGAHALVTYGFPAGDVVLQPGSEISERMRRHAFADLVREATLEEGSLCREYDELARGGAILSVHTPTPADVSRACHIMTAYGAHSLLHFGGWAISELPAEERCWA